jgi:hypothetical protein
MEKGATTGKKAGSEEAEEEGLNLGDKDMNCIVYNIFLSHMKLGHVKKAYEVFIKEIMPLN